MLRESIVQGTVARQDNDMSTYISNTDMASKVYIHSCISVYMYTYSYVFFCIHIHIDVYIRMNIYMYIHLYVYIPNAAEVCL
jgi:hypothetical protein